jgi:ribosomal protein S14
MRKIIQKTKNVQKQVIQNELELQAYLTLTKNEIIPFRFRTKAYLLLNKELQKGYRTRPASFCQATQRGRGSYRIFNLSRSVLKDAVNAGLLKGVANSS